MGKAKRAHRLSIAGNRGVGSDQESGVSDQELRKVGGWRSGPCRIRVGLCRGWFETKQKPPHEQGLCLA